MENGARLFLAYLRYVFAEPVRYHASLDAAPETLSSGLAAARCRFVTRVAVMTGRQELRVGVVGPDVCGLHSIIAVLTVGDSISRESLHPGHLPHTAPRILDKPILRRKLPNKVENVRINFIAELCVIADRVEISGFFILSPVVRYRRNAECSAVRRCPYNVGMSEAVDYLLRCQLGYVLVQRNVLEVLVPLHREHLVTALLKSTPDRAGTCEQFQYL